MRIEFKKVKIHHFLSYDNAEITLNNRGFCNIIGINKNLKDSAKSNGAGKSSIINAISYALTGETTQGIKTNLPNRYFNDGCWVEVEAKIDGHDYVITRYRDDPKLKTDLKIIIDGKDSSGKGIRDSQAILSKLLPDLTPSMLNSVVILGQGLPSKFSNNTPAGRKEVLEKLSKSDFMIEDIKNRINNRETVLSNKIRSNEDNILKANTEIQVLTKNLQTNKELLEKLNVTIDYDAEISKLNPRFEELKRCLVNWKIELDKHNKNVEIINEENNRKVKEENDAIYKAQCEHDGRYYSKANEKNKLFNTRACLNQEISNLKNIKDVCPTCGQKIPGIVKKDTSKQEEQVKELTKKIDEFDLQMQAEDKWLKDTKDKINESYDTVFNNITEKMKKEKSFVKDFSDTIHEAENEMRDIEIKINKLKVEKETHNKQIKDTKEVIAQIEADIKNNNNLIVSLTKDKDNFNQHKEVIDKMNTYVKRDFRGYLLKNVIGFIDKKVKEYSKDVFGHEEFNFRLDGNDIEITYLGKAFDNLSGGEKQKVDIILQLALRSMMVKYLGFSSNILALDEIFIGIDVVGADKIINLISTKLSDVDTVFIISHREELQIPADNYITVEKDERGVSRII